MKLTSQQQRQFEANLALAYAQLQQQWDIVLFQTGAGAVGGAF